MLPVIGLYANSDEVLKGRSLFFLRWFSGAIILYIFWYFMWFLSSEKFKNRKWLFWLFPPFFFGLIHLILYSIDFNTQPHSIVRSGFVTILILIVQYGMRAQQNVSRLELEKEQIQTENYKAQLKALHAKIDPHFLFNSMNTLRSMVRQGHKNSENFIISLSDFYRQTLKYKENTTIELSEELEVLKSFLFLMKSRNEAAIIINLNIENSLNHLHLPTLALQIVVENCFKHNSMTSKMPLYIHIKNVNDDYILVANNIQPKIGDKERSGYGLNLLRKRYELMNIKKGLIIEETPQQYSVKLKLIRT